MGTIPAYFGHLFGTTKDNVRCPRMPPLQTASFEPPVAINRAAGRVQFITHKGKRVLSINYSNCDAATFKAVAEEGHRVIARELPNSVLTLNDVSGSGFDGESVEVLKSKVAANAPYVKRAAVIGISGLQRLIYEAVKIFTKRSIRAFSSRNEALDYLVAD
jgi:hypothetical protein